MFMLTLPSVYRGRLAPSPTGLLHLGHARTFWLAQERALADAGTLILRNEDLDGARMQTARARAGELLARTPLDDGDIHAG